MNSKQIISVIKKLKPHLERGDKQAIAKLADVDAQSVYLVFQNKHDLVKSSNVLLILSKTVEFLKTKPDYELSLQEQLKGL